MITRKGVLVSYDAASHTATVRIAGSGKSYMSGVTVATNIAAESMVSGSRLMVQFFNEHNAREAVVAGVW